MNKLDDYIKLAESATDGPWEVRGASGENVYFARNYGVSSHGWMIHNISGEENRTNMQFIAASRTLGPPMARALIEAEEALRLVQHRDAMWTDEELPVRKALATIKKLKENEK